MATPRPRAERPVPARGGAVPPSPSPALLALGDPTRQRLLSLLAGGELAVGELVVRAREAGPISQPAVSQHLRVLLDAGLVAVRADGTRRCYSVAPAGVAAAQGWLGALVESVAPWPALDALETEVARGRRATRPSAGVRSGDGRSGDVRSTGRSSGARSSGDRRSGRSAAS